jgi:hypothetical protein
MKKIKNESALFKAAVEAGRKYGESRGVVEFEPSDTLNEKALYIYRLLVHDKLLVPWPEEQVSRKSIRHRRVLWHMRQLRNDGP